MGISGCGLDIGMTEKFLNYPNIGTGCSGQGGKGMTAAMRRQAAYRRLRLSQLTEKGGIIPAEISGMEQGTILRTEQIFSGMREMLQTVSKFRQKRYSAELIAKLPIVEEDKQISLIGAVADVMVMISECQAVVDAVEVCYCKDCKHYALWADECATNHCDKRDCTAYDDDFCSCGERKVVQAFASVYKTAKKEPAPGHPGRVTYQRRPKSRRTNSGSRRAKRKSIVSPPFRTGIPAPPEFR